MTRSEPSSPSPNATLTHRLKHSNIIPPIQHLIQHPTQSNSSKQNPHEVPLRPLLHHPPQQHHKPPQRLPHTPARRILQQIHAIDHHIKQRLVVRIDQIPQRLQRSIPRAQRAVQRRDPRGAERRVSGAPAAAARLPLALGQQLGQLADRRVRQRDQRDRLARAAGGRVGAREAAEEGDDGDAGGARGGGVAGGEEGGLRFVGGFPGEADVEDGGCGRGGEEVDAGDGCGVGEEGGEGVARRGEEGGGLSVVVEVGKVGGVE